MRFLLAFFFLLVSFAQAKPRFLFTGEGFNGLSMTSTTIGDSAEGYWVFNDEVGPGTYTVENNSTFGSSSSKVVGTLWSTSSNTKTAYLDGLLTAHVGASGGGARAALVIGWDGQITAVAKHPINGYCCQNLVAGETRLLEANGTGMSVILGETTFVPANAADYYIGIRRKNGILSCYASNTPITIYTTPLITVADTTWAVAAGIGIMSFDSTGWYDLIKFDDLTQAGLRGPKLRNNLRLILGFLPILFVPFQLEAHENQVSQSLRHRYESEIGKTMQVRLRRTVTPPATPTPGSRATATRTPTT